MHSLKAIPKVISYILKPIKEFPATFLCLAFALFLPELIEYPFSEWFNYFCNRIVNHVLLCSAISYLISCFVYIVSKRFKRVGLIIVAIFHIIIFSIVIGDIFLYKFFNTHINSYILQLLDETNPQESSEFIETYVLNNSTIYILLGLIGFALFEFLIYLIGRSIRNSFKDNDSKQLYNWSYKTLKGILLLLIFSSIGYLVMNAPAFSFNWQKNMDRTWGWKNIAEGKVVSSFVFKTNQAFLQFFEERQSFKQSSKAQDNIIATIEGEPIPNIIIVIGESYNRHHSNLYDYNHNTNPRLSQLKNLYVFDDVITSVNGTSQAFKDFLSFASVDDTVKWYNTPLFPSVFKKVGYNVIFYSNQFVQELNKDAYDASCGFFNHPEVEPKIFNHKNNQKFPYDGLLIDDYKKNRTKIESDSLNLILFHLYGQHVNPIKRFPESQAVFNSSSYERPELSEAQKQEVANYDNATLYNDSVLAEIIKMYEKKDAVILCFADHGDEANDYRIHLGRSRNLKSIGAPCLHCQMDIPFMIYLTDDCIANHPDLEKRISRSLHLPFMTDDLPHLLLDIANIHSPWFQPSRSLINEQFNYDRKRMVNDYGFAAPTDYDSLCNSYGEWKIGFNNQ